MTKMLTATETLFRWIAFGGIYMFEQLKKVISPKDRRKEHSLRAALDNLSNVAQGASNYHLEVEKAQSALNSLYEIEKRRAKSMRGILMALEHLTDMTIPLEKQIKKVLKVLVKTSKSDSAFVFKVAVDGGLKIIENEGRKPIDSKLDGVKFVSEFPSLTPAIETKEPIFLKRADFTEDELKIMSKETQAVCIIPLFHSSRKDELWGVLGMAIYAKGLCWSDYDRLMFSSFGNIVTGCLELSVRRT